MKLTTDNKAMIKRYLNSFAKTHNLDYNSDKGEFLNKYHIDALIKGLEDTSLLHIGNTNPTGMKKYIVIDTWNGEGYSSDNGTDTKQFDCKEEAFKWAYERALSNTAPLDTKKYPEQVGQFSDSNWFKGEPKSNGDGYWFEGYDDNHGSYQVWETDNAYAIMIQCNVNEVTVLTKEEYVEQIQTIDEDIKTHIKENKNNPYAITNMEELVSIESNGDRFCHQFDDYDYQFRLIQNLKKQ